MLWFPVVAAALFTFTDPAGDARGDGSYVLPTRPAISAEALDLRTFQAEQVEGKMRFTLDFGGVQNPWKLASGFSAGVTDIFVRTSIGGITTLDTLGFRPSDDTGWLYHLRVTGAGSRLEKADQGTAPLPMAAPQARMEGTALVIDSEIPAGQYAYWVTSSVYSPLTSDGLLRPQTKVGPQGLRAGRANAPVPVDVLASEPDRAYLSGELRAVGQTRDLRPWLLLGLGLLGLLITLIATVRVWRTELPR